MKNNDGMGKDSTLWGEWIIEQQVGIGSYGKVYKIINKIYCRII